ncbi:MAG: putative metal-binding motif-containing protein [Sandaracinaceae bacterium]|nr:putative metal-binding motif-containing protein [Sandaracinaceae bacterium]
MQPLLDGQPPRSGDGLDNNCVGGVDEGVLTTFYRDADMDSRGNPAMSMMARTAPSGYVNNSDDCNDACNTCWTGNAESCDALDNNCSGVPDEGFACIRGSAQPCTTTCGTTGTGSCTAACLLPVLLFARLPRRDLQQHRRGLRHGGR